jgi:hypothetical protein
LMEDAAKAAEIHTRRYEVRGFVALHREIGESWVYFDPLKSLEDAMLVAISLGMKIDLSHQGSVLCWLEWDHEREMAQFLTEPHDGDVLRALKRCIVRRAAAEWQLIKGIEA